MPHSESESEDQEYESQPLKNSTTPVSEISQFLIQARNASEEQKNVSNIFMLISFSGRRV